jgi:hypothetical protein
MTNQEIILQLSEVIAEQKKQISILESTKDYLRGLNDENVNQINKLYKEIEKLTTKPIKED